MVFILTVLFIIKHGHCWLNTKITTILIFDIICHLLWTGKTSLLHRKMNLEQGSSLHIRCKDHRIIFMPEELISTQGIQMNLPLIHISEHNFLILPIEFFLIFLRASEKPLKKLSNSLSI